MDRVLLVMDDIQYSRHVEMTLRKVGFDVESINSEFNINETLLTFNPDYVICRGNSARLSTLNVGKRLKDSAKFNGRVILIFADDFKAPPEEMLKIKMDLMLIEPISTLRVAIHLFSLSGGDFEFIKDKLVKFAITDNQFRQYEQQHLRNAGMTVDSEIQIVSDMSGQPPAPEVIVVKSETQAEPQVPVTGEFEPASAESLKRISEEVVALEAELPLRIDSYNHVINKVDQDLSVGLKKRQTKTATNKLRKDLIEEQKTDTKTEQELDEERRKFTKALFKK